jgi:aryl-alcohol dehydrogenase-like predicted oxidoreductase
MSNSTPLPTRRLGSAGPVVSCIGLGCMGMSFAYGPADESESLRVLHRYVELGGSFLDTAEIYGPFDNEILVGKFLRELRAAKPVVATKFGFDIDPATRERRGVDSRPQTIRRVCEQSLGRLGLETIDLFYQHRVDPKVPIEEVAGTLAELIRAG